MFNIAVKLNANRMVVGTLRGFDQFMNLVIDNTVEVNGNDKNDIGMVVGSLSCSFFFFFFGKIPLLFIVSFMVNYHGNNDNRNTAYFIADITFTAAGYQRK